jgi:ribosomal-protein-alanine N-acetyltransferase
MKFQALPSTEHPLVYLRPLTEADMEPWSQYLNLPEVYHHTSWNHPSPQELLSYLGNEMDNEPSGRLRLAIADRENDHLVGTIGFHTVSEQNRSAEIAYDLHPSMWHKGLATAIATAVVAWAHNEAALLRVQATVLESNTSSIRVLQRVGFVQEGLLQSYRFVRGTPGNFYMYSHVTRTPSDA